MSPAGSRCSPPPLGLGGAVALFGGAALLTLLPIIFVLPYIVQHRQNSWIGVVIHAGVNGPGFLAVAFGLA